MSAIKPYGSPIRENEVLLKEKGQWLHFSGPQRVITAGSHEEVLPALREIERAIQADHLYAAGFLAYEAAPAFDPALQTCPAAGFPYLWFGLYPPPQIVTLPRATRRKPIEWLPTVNRETYNEAIDQIKQEIARGSTYQVNYTMRLQADFASDPWTFFLHLAGHGAPHAAYLDTGQFVICSASPELFFELDGDTITCKPMKGTARRGRTTAEDRDQEAWLRHSEKNRAENVMIVDMVRNDLGRIAQTGSVQVPLLFRTERYSTVWQMTSTVSATTHASLTDILTALFPCASITGAPKVSTMEIIARLEKTPREIYTGSIGYVSPQRNAKFNVAIRTALIDRERHKAAYGVGGGIVWDSTSPDEYAEALLKARVLTEPAQDFCLLETMRWTPQEGFFLREEHVARLLDSAGYFNFPITREEVQAYLARIRRKFDSPRRIRLLVEKDGSIHFDSDVFDEANSSAPLTACLAKEPIDAGDVFLYHKTTQRAVYETARNSCKGVDDVLLYNQAGALTEFTIGNLVVELEDRLWTPPLSCGVLPGTFRRYLLETGEVKERVIYVEELQFCRRIFRINSVRKWQQVDLRMDYDV